MRAPRLQVYEAGARDVALIVGLVEEDVLAVAAARRVLLEDAVVVDAVLRAQALPELGADLRPGARSIAWLRGRARAWGPPPAASRRT